MAEVNLSRSAEIDTAMDSVVIQLMIEDIVGGRSLDVSAYPLDIIKAGHIIIENDNTGELSPLGQEVSEAILTFGTLTAGSGYANDGTYTDVDLTGGTGSGATADIVVSGGAVTSVVVVNGGTGFKAGDSLTAAAADIGEDGSGFAVTVGTVDNSLSGSYVSLPANHTYKGILYRTITKAKALASIMVRGTVNIEAAKNYGLPAYPAGAVTELSLIRFIKN